ncbi:MAG: S9 family peptidase [Bacteroidales bacterium]|nr:S9 family peptidase [Bacteroidales bacterium]
MANCSKTETGGSYIGPSSIVPVDGQMTPEVLLSLGRLSDPQLSPDGQTILFGVSYTSIEENRSCRNIFICNVDGSGRKQLTRSGKSISCARWADVGKSILYIKGGQIYKAAYSSGKLSKGVQISNVPAGISEFSLSPDGAALMYVSTVHGPVTVPSDYDPALDKAQAYVTEDLMYRHWDHWTTETPHTYIAAMSGDITPDKSLDILGEDSAYELPIEPFGGLEQLCWSPDGRFVAYSCKKLSGKEYAFSTNTDIYIYNIRSGETVQVSFGGGYDTDPVWSPDGKSLAWLSMARDGYEADRVVLKVADLETGEGTPGVAAVRAAEDFPYNVSSPVWSPDSKSIYFSALYDKAVQGIFQIAADDLGPRRLEGCFVVGSARCVTPVGEWLDFGSPFAVLDGTLLASYSSMDFPTELVSVNIRSGEHSQITHENDHILDALGKVTYELRMVPTVDGKQMPTWVLFPPEFDPSKKYPAIEILLGGPQGTLSQDWSYRWNYRLMASQGYVVVLPNRRGTTAFGQEWCEQISGDYVGLNMQDYLSAARMIKAEPYIGKLAACGASYGGFSVYYMAGIHGDVFDCFIAHAGIFDEKYMYYETEEMWFPNWDNGGLQEYRYTPGQTGPAGDGVTFGGMRQGGSPWSSLPKAQRHYSNSPAVNVTAWHTPILCIHGGMDFRIPYDQGMAAFNSARMMGVPAKLVVFPEENHWILQPQNALFWHRTYFDWLDKWCKK